MTKETTDTAETKLALDTVAGLDGGGSRLAVHGPLVAVGTDEDVTLWRDLRREATYNAPDAIDRLRLDVSGNELLAAPYVLDFGGKAWTSLVELEPALSHGLDGPPSGDLRVRRGDWSLMDRSYWCTSSTGRLAASGVAAAWPVRACALIDAPSVPTSRR